MASTNLRTVWITLRATNYTAQAFSAVARQCDWLEVKEKRLMTQNLRLGTAAISAGLMFNTMGDQIGGVGGELMKQASLMMYVVGVLGYLKAGYIILTGINWAHMTSVLGVAMSYKMLAISAAAAFGAFLLVYNALIALNNPMVSGVIAVIAGITAALWMLFVAESAATMGVGLAIGGAAAGAALATAKQMGAFQMGTRMIAATGPVIAHKGEIIYNPSTGRPTQTQNDLANSGASTIIYEIPITIETVNTKADIDDVDEKIGKAIKRAANRSK
jgi:hypothetical protein